MKPEDLAKSGSEFGEQGALFCWLNSKEARDRFPALYRTPYGTNKDGSPCKVGKCKVYAVNNNVGSTGGDDTEERKKTNAIRGAMAKQSGVTSDVPDLFVPVARHGMHGLFIEMKIDPAHPMNQRTGTKGQAIAPKRGVASDGQKNFGRHAIEDGFGWVVCEGWKAARDVIIQYME